MFDQARCSATVTVAEWDVSPPRARTASPKPHSRYHLGVFRKSLNVEMTSDLSMTNPFSSAPEGVDVALRVAKKGKSAKRFRTVA